MLTLPFPPSVNHYWRIFNGRAIVSAEGRKYRNKVAERLRRAYGLSGRLRISILAVMPDKRRRDLDNLLKASLDAMQNAGVYLDDSQIDHIEVARGHIEKPGRLEVLVREVE